MNFQGTKLIQTQQERILADSEDLLGAWLYYSVSIKHGK